MKKNIKIATCIVILNTFLVQLNATTNEQSEWVEFEFSAMLLAFGKPVMTQTGVELDTGDPVANIYYQKEDKMEPIAAYNGQRSNEVYQYSGPSVIDFYCKTLHGGKSQYYKIATFDKGNNNDNLFIVFVEGEPVDNKKQFRLIKINDEIEYKDGRALFFNFTNSPIAGAFGKMPVKIAELQSQSISIEELISEERKGMPLKLSYWSHFQERWKRFKMSQVMIEKGYRLLFFFYDHPLGENKIKTQMVVDSSALRSDNVYLADKN